MRKNLISSIVENITVWAGFTAIQIGEKLYGREFLEKQDFEYEIEMQKNDLSRKI